MSLNEILKQLVCGKKQPESDWQKGSPQPYKGNRCMELSVEPFQSFTVKITHWDGRGNASLKCKTCLFLYTAMHVVT